MFEYELDGVLYTMANVEKWAMAENISVDDYASKYALNKKEVGVNIAPPIIGDSDIEHISLEDFSAAAGNEGFYDYSEDELVKQMQESYKGTGVEFSVATFGRDAIAVKLPGTDNPRVFRIPSDDPTALAEFHFEVTSYIDSKKKKHMEEDLAQEITAAWNGEQGFWAEENITEKLNKILGDDYTVTESGTHYNEVTITTKSGASRNFKIGKLWNSADAVVNTAKDVIDWIESDPVSFESSKEYHKAEQEVIQELEEEFFTKDMLKDIFGRPDFANIATSKNKERLKEHILAELNATGGVRTNNDKLSNVHMDHIVTAYVSEKVDVAWNNKITEDYNIRLAEYIAEGKSNADIHKHNVKAHSLSFSEIDQSIIHLYQQIDTAKGERKEALIKKLNLKIHEKKKAGDEYKILMDTNTGKIASHNLSEDTKGIVDITRQVELEQENYKGLTRADLKVEFNRLSLALAQFEKASKDPSYKGMVDYGGDNMMITYEQYAGSWRAVREVGFIDTVSENAEFEARMAQSRGLRSKLEAIKRMYLLNEGVESIEKDDATGLLNIAKATLVGGIIGEDRYLDLYGDSEAQVVNSMLGAYEEMGIPLTKEAKLHGQTSLSEMTVAGLAAIPKVALEFAVANKIAAGVSVATGLHKFMQGLKAYKYARRGVVFSEQEIIRRAGMINKTPGAYIAELGFTKVPPTLWANAQHLAISSVIEGVKFAGVEQDPRAFSSGVGFGLIGGLLPKEVFKAFPRLQTMYSYGAAGVSMSIGSEVGETMAGLVDDLFEIKDFSVFMDEHYGSYNETQKRMISNLFVGMAFRLGHTTRFDFRSKDGIVDIRDTAHRKLEEIVEKEGENFMESSEWQKHYEIFQAAEMRLASINGLMDYNNPLLAQSMAERDFAGARTDFNSMGYKLEVTYTNPKGNRKGSYELDTNNKIVKITINPAHIKAGVVAHEIHHAYMELQLKDLGVKAEVINGLVSISKTIKVKGGKTLYEKLVENGTIAKRTNSGLGLEKVREMELFAWVSEVIRDGGNQKELENSNAWWKLKTWINKTPGGENVGTKTKQDLIKWFGEYHSNLGKGISNVPHFNKLGDIIKNTGGEVIKEASTKDQRNIEIASGKENRDRALLEEMADMMQGFGKEYKGMGSDILDPFNIELQEIFNKEDSFLSERDRKDIERMEKFDYSKFPSEKVPEIRRRVEADLAKLKSKDKSLDIARKYDISLAENQGAGASGGSGRVAKLLDSIKNRPDFGIHKDAILKEFLYGKEGRQSESIYGNAKAYNAKVLRGEINPAEWPIGKYLGTYMKEHFHAVANRHLPAEHVTRIDKEGAKVLEGGDYTSLSGGGGGKTYKKNIKLEKTVDAPLINIAKDFNVPIEIIQHVQQQLIANRFEHGRNLDISVPKGKGKLISIFGKTPLERAQFLMDHWAEIHGSIFEGSILRADAFKPGVDTKTPLAGDILLHIEKVITAKEAEINAIRAERKEATTPPPEFSKETTIEARIKAIEDYVSSKNPEFKPDLKASSEQRILDLTKAGEYDITKVEPSTEQLIGTSSGVLGGVLKDLYVKGDRMRYAETGSGVGVAEQLKKSYSNQAEFGAEFGIKLTPEGKVIASSLTRNFKETKMETIAREFERSLHNQVLRAMVKGGHAPRELAIRYTKQEIISRFEAGKPTGLASEILVREISEMHPEITNEGIKSSINAFLRGARDKKNPLHQLYDRHGLEAIKQQLLEITFFERIQEGIISHESYGHVAKNSYRQTKNHIFTLKNGMEVKLSKETSDLMDPTNKSPELFEAVSNVVNDLVSSAPKGHKLIANLFNGNPALLGTKKQSAAWEGMNQFKKGSLPSPNTIAKWFSEIGEKVGSRDKILDHNAKMRFIETAFLKELKAKIYESKTAEEFQTNFAAVSAILNKAGKNGLRLTGEYVSADIRLADSSKNASVEHLDIHSKHLSDIWNWMRDGHGHSIESIMENRGLALVFNNSRLTFDKTGGPLNSAGVKRVALDGVATLAHTADIYGASAYKVFFENANSFLSKKEIGKAFKEFNKLMEHNNKLGIGKAESFKLASENLSNIEKAIQEHKKKGKADKGISVWDFDDTLAHSKSNVLFELPTGEKGKLTAEEFANRGTKMLEQGAKFDFSEFNKVVDGKPGPLFEKFKERIHKFGPEHNYILTARPTESAIAIREFLKSQGIDIPLKNITGLADSKAEAKAQWMVKKFAEGYNDFYFADDAIQNVKAVRSVLNKLDAKSSVQQAQKKMWSEDFDKTLNLMIERVFDIPAGEEISGGRGKGKGKNKDRWLGGHSISDFELLTYRMFGKGKEGEGDQKFIKDAITKPYLRGRQAMHTANERIAKELDTLHKKNPEFIKSLKDPVNADFTKEQAIRVFLWNKVGSKVPHLTKGDQNMLIETVVNDPYMITYANILHNISRLGSGAWVKPSKNWTGETLRHDLFEITHGNTGRQKYLKEAIDNMELIFSPKNMNKLEAALGTTWRKNMEEMITRMTTGSSRNNTTKHERMFVDWVNGAAGVTMHLNMRSALTQSVSMLNYVELGVNNPLAIAKHAANPKQAIKDFMDIINSDYLRQRRKGGVMELSMNDISEVANNPASSMGTALIAKLLSKGYAPTKWMDSFAIAFGGSAYYRNYVNHFLKKGKSQKEAESLAWEAFVEKTEPLQQSSDQMFLSSAQSTTFGRLLFTYKNTPVQMFRQFEKARLDLASGRGRKRDNIAKMIYYGPLQSAMFYAIQSSLWTSMFDDDEVVTDAQRDQQKGRIYMGVMDGFLQGSGVPGNALVAIKNTALQAYKEGEQGYRGEKGDVYEQTVGLFPSVGTKIRNIGDIYDTFFKFDKNYDISKKEGLSIHNPFVLAGAQFVSTTTNIPLDRYIKKSRNVQETMDARNAWWQRLGHFFGSSSWDMGTEVEHLELIKQEVTEDRKAKGIEKGKQTRKENKEKKEAEIEDATKNMSGPDKLKYIQRQKLISKYGVLPLNWDSMSGLEQLEWKRAHKKKTK